MGVGKAHVFAIALAAFALGAAIGLLASAADALLLSQLGAAHVGTSFALSSALLFVVLPWVGKVADKHSRATLLLWLGLASLVFLVCAFALSRAFPSFGVLLFFVASKQVAAVLEMVLWLTLAEAFGIRRSAALVPYLAAIHGVGGICGALGVGFLGGDIVDVVVWGVLCLGVFTMGAALLVKRSHRHPRQLLAKTPHSNRVSLRNIGLAHPMIRRLAYLSFFAALFLPMLYYLLGLELTRAYSSKEELAQVLGRFRSLVSLGIVLVQLAVAPLLSKHARIGHILLVAPVLAVAVASLLAVQMDLVLVMICFGAMQLADKAAQNPGEQLVQNLVEPKIRGRAATLIGGVSKRGGAVLGGGLASGLLVYPSLVAPALVCAAVAWASVAVYFSQNASAMALAELKGQPLTHAVATGPTIQWDAKTCVALAKELAEASESEKTHLLAFFDTTTIKAQARLSIILTSLAHSETFSEVVHRALWLLAGSGTVTRLEDSSLVLRLYEKSLLSADLALAFRCDFPEHRKPVSSSVTHAEMMAEASPLWKSLVMNGPSCLQAFSDFEDREALVLTRAALLMRAAEPASALPASMRDELVGATLSDVGALAGSELQVLATRGIVLSLRLGKESAVSILYRSRLSELARRWEGGNGLQRQSAAIAHRYLDDRDAWYWTSALGEFNCRTAEIARGELLNCPKEAVAALLEALQSPSLSLRIKAEQVLLEFSLDTFSDLELVEDSLEELASLSIARRWFHNAGFQSLLLVRLEQRKHRLLRQCIFLLYLKDGLTELDELYRSLSRVHDPMNTERDLETLRTVLPTTLARTLLDAWDGILRPGVVSTGSLYDSVVSQLSGRDPIVRSLLIHSLRGHGDHPTATLPIREILGHAARTLATKVDLTLVGRLEASGKQEAEEELISAAEALIAMSRLTLFSGVGVEELDAMRRTVSWHQLTSGEVLWEQGSEASSMFFVVSGRLSVTRDQALVGQVQPGEPVGELALFAHEDRSASVICLEDALLGELSRLALEEIISDSPQLALPLCRAISRRALRNGGLV